MTNQGPIEPLRLVFRVECSPEHAFMTWTQRIAAWWPADHTASGEPDLEVVLEGASAAASSNGPARASSTNGARFSPGSHRIG